MSVVSFKSGKLRIETARKMIGKWSENGPTWMLLFDRKLTIFNAYNVIIIVFTDSINTCQHNNTIHIQMKYTI